MTFGTSKDLIPFSTSQRQDLFGNKASHSENHCTRFVDEVRTEYISRQSVTQWLRGCIANPRSWVRSSLMKLLSQTFHPLARFLSLIAYFQHMVALRPSSCSGLTRLGIYFFYFNIFLVVVIFKRNSPVDPETTFNSRASAHL